MLLIPECRRRLRSGRFVVAACCVLVSQSLDARAQQNYGAYFNQQGSKYGGQLGTQSVDRYMYDKYFYQRPSVSPYLNLDRPDPYGGTSYQYVRQEQQRRDSTIAAQSSYIDARKKQGNVGRTLYPGATYGQAGTALVKPVPQQRSTPSAYYNHWYGGWAGR